MTDNPGNDKLQQAIAAARRGDKLTARRLLQQILTEQRDNEVAWMWMASVADSQSERRACLERALKINPNNARAREALNRMGAALPAAARDASAVETPTLRQPVGLRMSRSLYFALAALVGIVVIAFALLALLPRGPSDEAVRQTATSFALAARATNFAQPAVLPTAMPPTRFVIVITRDPSLSQLEPTFTPTATSEPTATPPPSATPYPLSLFPLLYAAAAADAQQPSLFKINADGSSPISFNDGGLLGAQPAYSPDGQQVAFVRLVLDDAPGSDVLVPQLFVGPANDPASARQITQANGNRMSRPSWSPDSTLLVYASDEDGDEELYRIPASGGTPERLTDNDVDDGEPAYSPDGRFIVFTSDRGTPGSREIFRMAADGSSVIQLTNASGSSTQPIYSPDGQRIAFISDRGVDNDVYIMDANGQRPFLLTIDDGRADDRSPAWSPDGRWIAFASNRGGGPHQIYVVSLAGDVLLPVTSGGFSVDSLTFQPIQLP